MPRTCLPYMFFSFITSQAMHAVSSGSDSRWNGSPSFSRNDACDLRLSREMPTTVAPAFVKASNWSRKPEASVVQPFAYLQIVFVTVIGITIYGEVLHLHVAIGAAIVVMAGLFALMQARKSAE